MSRRREQLACRCWKWTKGWSMRIGSRSRRSGRSIWGSRSASVWCGGAAEPLLLRFDLVVVATRIRLCRDFAAFPVSICLIATVVAAVLMQMRPGEPFRLDVLDED